jgi:hypothetical protein
MLLIGLLHTGAGRRDGIGAKQPVPVPVVVVKIHQEGREIVVAGFAATVGSIFNVAPSIFNMKRQ